MIKKQKRYLKVYFQINLRMKYRGKKLYHIHGAINLNDLRIPPGNKLHALEGKRKGQHAICINKKWRICFT